MSAPTDDERHRFVRRAAHSIYGSKMTRPARRTGWLAYAGWAVLTFSVLVPAVELWRIGVLDSGEHLAIGIVATATYLPLHLRHVYHALQGRRPVFAVATLGAMTTVMVVAWVMIGQQWVF